MLVSSVGLKIERFKKYSGTVNNLLEVVKAQTPFLVVLWLRMFVSDYIGKLFHTWNVQKLWRHSMTLQKPFSAGKFHKSTPYRTSQAIIYAGLVALTPNSVERCRCFLMQYRGSKNQKPLFFDPPQWNLSFQTGTELKYDHNSVNLSVRFCHYLYRE